MKDLVNKNDISCAKENGRFWTCAVIYITHTVSIIFVLIKLHNSFGINSGISYCSPKNNWEEFACFSFRAAFEFAHLIVSEN